MRIRIISLGWGIQSFTLAAMSALGELPPVDYAIHADTTHERTDTYRFAKNWTRWLDERGVKVVTVKPVEATLIDKWGGVTIPAYSETKNGGVIRRQCTGQWKIKPVRRWLQANRNGQPVEQWLGITLDEVQRMKMSNVKYIINRYPLIEKRMTRWDCVRWLQSHGLEVPPRSACIFCPFHSRSEWRDIRDNATDDWQKAMQVDEEIRSARPPHDLFVNVQRKPLAECDLDNDIDKGQLSLWENECDGLCGI